MVSDPRRRSLLVCALFGLVGTHTRAGTHRRLDLWIASVGDELLFAPNRLHCYEHAPVRLHFQHRGRISSDSHDWVLLKPGTVQSFLDEADRQPDERVIPPGHEADVIAATTLCSRGRTVTVDFTAPSAGDYPFVCSVAGHGTTMRGMLTVLPRKPSARVTE